MLLDQWKRPVAIYQKHPLLGVRLLDPFMKAQRSSEPGEVLHRALTRSALHHFDPIVVLNEQGEFQGIARIDRLMRGILHSQRRGEQPLGSAA